MRNICYFTIALFILCFLLFTGCANKNTGAPLDVDESVSTDSVEYIKGAITDSVADEKKVTELTIIQTSVLSMMVDNKLESLAGMDYIGKNNGTFQNPTNDMRVFPVPVIDGKGYVLNGHVHPQDGSIVDYLGVKTTIFYYSVDEMGSVTQHDNPD